MLGRNREEEMTFPLSPSSSLAPIGKRYSPHITLFHAASQILFPYTFCPLCPKKDAFSLPTSAKKDEKNQNSAFLLHNSSTSRVCHYNPTPLLLFLPSTSAH